MNFSPVPGFAQRYPKDDCDACRDALLIESCCTSLKESLAAQSRGAGRIELCADLSVGGVTPPRELTKEVVSRLSIPVNVLVRPYPAVRQPSETEFAPADFVYSEADLEQMISDIRFCGEVGASGIVTGALRPDGAIDVGAMRRLVAAAAPAGGRCGLSVTFHRAFDCCADPAGSLETIIGLGCDRLLTSGQAATAWEGRDLIARLVKLAAGRIIIMPGRGVRPDNLDELAAFTSAVEFHGTAIP